MGHDHTHNSHIPKHAHMLECTHARTPTPTHAYGHTHK